jgi:predicted membrane-bound spermidine synthase
MRGHEVERTRAALAFGVLVGVAVTLVALIPLLPALGSAGFAAAGCLGAFPAFAVLAPRMGAPRAAAVAGLLALALGAGTAAVAFGAWLLSA